MSNLDNNLLSKYLFDDENTPGLDTTGDNDGTLLYDAAIADNDGRTDVLVLSGLYEPHTYNAYNYGVTQLAGASIVTIGRQEDLNNYDSLTIAAFARMTGKASGTLVSVNWRSGHTGHVHRIYEDNGSFYFQSKWVEYGSNAIYSFETDLGGSHDFSSWHHYVVVKDGFEWKHYVDSILVGTHTHTGSSSGIDPFEQPNHEGFGETSLGGTPGINPDFNDINRAPHIRAQENAWWDTLEGALDNVLIWGRSLDQTEVETLYNNDGDISPPQGENNMATFTFVNPNIDIYEAYVDMAPVGGAAQSVGTIPANGGSADLEALIVASIGADVATLIGDSVVSFTMVPVGVDPTLGAPLLLTSLVDGQSYQIEADFGSLFDGTPDAAFGAAAPAPAVVPTRLRGSRQVNMGFTHGPSGLSYATLEEAAAAGHDGVGELSSAMLDMKAMKVLATTGDIDLYGQDDAMINLGYITTKRAEDNAARDAVDAAEQARAMAAEAALQADVDQNEADADAAIAAEETRALAAEAALQADVDQNEADADAALAAEETRALAAEAALQADVDQNEADADAAIAAEESRALLAEAALQADVDQNEADADASFASATTDRALIRTEMETESVAREAAEAALQADVDQNESDADASFASATTDRALIRTEMEVESVARESAEAALQADIDQNEADADSAIAALQADVDQNEADADSAIAALQSDVDQNEADADSAISAEESRAMAAEGVLTSGLAVETSRLDAILLASDADKDSFAEIVTLINSVDTENDTAFASYVLSNNAAVAAVQADVDQNESDAEF